MATEKGTEKNVQKTMLDRIWDIIWWFFAATIVPGGFMFAYFGERGDLAFIMENSVLKGSIFAFAAVGSSCILYAEIRKRTKVFAFKKIIYTVIACFIILGIVGLFRL